MNHPLRWSGLDGAKFLCVLFMVFIHSTFWLITSNDEIMDTQSFLYPIIMQTTFLGLFPLSLPITAGSGLRIYLQKLQTGSHWEDLPLFPLIKASLSIMALGFLMTLLAWGWDHSLEWDVLHFVGLSYLVIALLLKVLSVPMLFCFGLLTLLLTPTMRALGLSGTLGGILVGDQSMLFFWPFFPWFATVVFGFALAHAYFAVRESKWFYPFLGGFGLAAVGLSLYLDSFFLVLDPHSVWGANVFQPAVGFVIGLMGFFSLLVFSLQKLSIKVDFSNWSLVRAYSDGILWIYLIHIIVGVRLSHLYKAYVPLNLFTVLFYSFLILLFSWVIGHLSVTLGGKQLKIKFAKAK